VGLLWSMPMRQRSFGLRVASIDCYASCHELREALQLYLDGRFPIRCPSTALKRWTLLAAKFFCGPRLATLSQICRAVTSPKCKCEERREVPESDGLSAASIFPHRRVEGFDCSVGAGLAYIPRALPDTTQKRPRLAMPTGA
jgi:hypothetical protein